MNDGFDTDIVDDSEPEREGIRLRARNAFKANNKHERATGNTNPTSYMVVTSEVIEISDSTSDEVEAISGRVIDISDITSVSEEDSVLERDRGYLSEAIHLPSKLSPWQGNGPELPLEGSAETGFPNSHVANNRIASDSDIEDESGIDFRRFAYKGNEFSSKQKPMASTATQEYTLTDESVKSSNKRKKRGNHRLLTKFTGAQLSKLSRCVSCDMQWTTRKTAVQKAAHIQSCARKRHLTEDTVDVLIANRIDTQVTTTTVTSKSDVGELPTQFRSTTFEMITMERTSSRRAKQRVLETVRSVEDTRHAILDRARSILGLGDSDDNAAPPSSTQKFEPSRLDARCSDSEAASPFQPSHLQRLLNSDEGDTVDGPRFSLSPRLGETTYEQYDSFHSRPGWPALSEKEGCLPILQKRPLSRLREKVALKRVHEISPTNKGSVLPEETDICLNQLPEPSGFGDDDASLHYMPERRRGQASSVLAVETEHFRPLDSLISPVEDMYGSCSDQSQTSIRQVGSSRLAGRTKRHVPETDEDEWEQRIKERIIQDEELHLRILRYEPIHFDAFLKLACDNVNNTQSAKLRSRLQSFLDKHAIIFYGADPKPQRRY